MKFFARRYVNITNRILSDGDDRLFNVVRETNTHVNSIQLFTNTFWVKHRLLR